MSMNEFHSVSFPGFPRAQGLYDPVHEKDSCGIGFVAHIKGQKSHEILRNALQVLENLTHRGAQGCDPCTGDGAGVLSQIPHGFFQRVCGELGIRLPGAGAYGVGMAFLPQEAKARKQCEALLESIIREEGQGCSGKRGTYRGPGPNHDARHPAILHRPRVTQSCSI